MKRTHLRISMCVIVVCVLSVAYCFGICPSADLTGDCVVDVNDFAVMASQWLTEGEPLPILYGMTWVSINDPGVPGHEGFTGEMSKYEITNAQYCEYLNAAIASGEVYFQLGSVKGGGVIYYNPGDGDAQISYSEPEDSFSVETRDGFDMSDHPVTAVSWYGATAFCNHYGFRLPTEWEWQAVADYDGSYTYACGTTIDPSRANYNSANPLGLSNDPYTTPVDYYEKSDRLGPFGYGMSDMAGNLWEFTSTLSSSGGQGQYIIRGGSFSSTGSDCAVSSWWHYGPGSTGLNNIGFRVCR